MSFRVVSPPAEYADELVIGALVTASLQAGYAGDVGAVRGVHFRVLRCSPSFALLTSLSDRIAFCALTDGKSWPCGIAIVGLTRAGAAASPQTAVWTVQDQTRLNRHYPLRGWWRDELDPSRSLHASANP